MSCQEEVKDEFKDSGLESQPTSQDEEEVSSVLMEEVLSNMKKLTGDELPGDDARHRSPAQVEQLKMVFKVSMFLSKQQKAIMSEKLSIDPIKIHYWFADARKKLKNKDDRLAKNQVDRLKIDMAIESGPSSRR